MTYSGQIVFIVGGSSGIGRAAACQLARQGAKIAIFARRPDVVEDARQDIISHSGQSAENVGGYTLDASDFGQTTDVFATAIDDMGCPTVLINSAGSAEPCRFVEMEPDQLERIFRSNVLTCWNSCKAMVPHMVARGSGTIVNISSLAGVVGVYGYTDYCLSKFGLSGFSEALRSELKPEGVDVKVFFPPDTQTPGYDAEGATKPAETAALSEGAKLMEAEPVAEALIKGIFSKKYAIFANSESVMFWYAQRFIPRLLQRYLDNIIAKVQARP